MNLYLRSISIGILIYCALPVHGGNTSNATIKLKLDKPGWEVSPYLTGSHFVYSFEKDALYQDNVIADWMKRAKVGVIRYPGGTVTMYYHWDTLNGYPFSDDSWGPNYELKPRPGDEFMDLDEYMHFCKRVGAEPMLGINYNSGFKYRTPEDSQKEAQRLVSYCRKKGYSVKFWYIGNEGYAKGYGHKKLPGIVDTYAEIIKKVFPEAMIIVDWKYGPEKKKRFEESLAITKKSKHLGMMEYHEKWGNEWGLKSGMTREDWLAEKPFLYKGEFSEFYKRFEEHNRKEGRNVLHSHNEWGIGGMSGNQGPFDFALLMADFFIEIFRHPTYMACYWNLNIGTRSSRIYVVEGKGKDKGKIKLQPTSLVYEMVAQAMENNIIPMESSNPSVYGFAVKNNKTPTTQVFLLNKSEDTVALSFQPQGMGFGITSEERLVSPGEIIKNTYGMPPEKITLKPMSFTRIIGMAK